MRASGRSLRPWGLLALLVPTAGACSKQSNSPVSTSRLAAYVATSPCASHTDPSSCGADTADHCAWRPLRGVCPEGTACPSGSCEAADPCPSSSEETSCRAATGCAWSRVEQLCPAGEACEAKGFCHGRGPDGNGCGCLSPLFCPAGVPCPPPECDCSGQGEGGTCGCSCPPCAAGEACPPCSCFCSSGTTSGCVAQGTCACVCPMGGGATGAGMPPSCDCDCREMGSVATAMMGMGGMTVPAPPSATLTGSLPSTFGAPSPATSEGGWSDPCTVYADSSLCRGVATTGCTWLEMGTVSPACVGCTSSVWGTCLSTFGGGATGVGMGCGCACPMMTLAYPASPSAPRCACDCGGSSAGGCIPPPATTPILGGGGMPMPMSGAE